MKNKTVIFLLIVLVSVSCSTDYGSNKKIKTIHLKETEDFLPVSSFIEDINYIELSIENNHSVIGEIEDLKLLDKDIILKQNIGRETSLLRFSDTGKFLNKIGINGNGPDEILNPRDIILYNEGYAVWDQMAVHSISKTGKYTRKIFDAQVPGNNCFYFKNKFFLFHELTSPGLLSEYSEKGKLVKTFAPNEFDFAGMGYSKVVYLAQNEFHLFSPIIDTVFSFNGIKLLPVYLFDSGPYPSFSRLMKKYEGKHPLELLKYLNNNQHFVVDRYLENRNFIYIGYRLGSNPFHLLIKKKNWELIYFKKCFNDIDGGLWEEPLYLSDDDVLYIPLYPYQIQNHKIANKYNKDFNILQDKTILNDNPVIMCCKLK